MIKDLGEPGEYPFTRALHPQGYRSRAWTTRQYTGFGTPAETNERFKMMISHGQTGLNVAFDLPTQMGYDSDHPRAEGEVGRVGMAVDTLRDFEIAFGGIALDKIGSGLTINAVATIMLAMYQAMAEKMGFDKKSISATPQNDILKEMIGRGAWIFPVEPAVRLVGDTIELLHDGTAPVQPGFGLRVPTSVNPARIRPRRSRTLFPSPMRILMRWSNGAIPLNRPQRDFLLISIYSVTCGNKSPSFGRLESCGPETCGKNTM